MIVGRASELVQFAPESFQIVPLFGNEHDAAMRDELHRSLTALEAVLRGHFEKEERVYSFCASTSYGEGPSVRSSETGGHAWVSSPKR